MTAARDFDWDDVQIDATRQDGLPRVKVYTPRHVAVVMGRASKAEIEVNVEEIRRDRVPLLKRRGGGCSVVLDPGNIVVSATFPFSGFGGIPWAFSSLSTWVINALAGCGVDKVSQAGISDFVIGDLKVGGACIYRTKGLLHYSTTLLLDPDLQLVERYLRHPPREPAYRRGRPHGAFMGSLGPHLESTDAVTFTGQLRRLLNSTLGASFESLLSKNNSQEVLA